MAFNPATLALTAIVKGGMSAMGQISANKAQEAQAAAQQEFIDRRIGSQRDALKENSSRLRENKKRSLAEMRVAQAASGMAASGSQLIVAGGIESRLDERINEALNQGLNRISSLSAQREMVGFASEQKSNQLTGQLINTAITAAGNSYSGYRSGYRQTGEDPWNLFN